MFYESDLKYLASEIAALQKKYDICAKFVLGEKGEGYVCLGISKEYNMKYFVPNPKLIPEILCEQAYYPDYLYPYQTFFQIKEEDYLTSFINILQMARKLEGIKHAYAWYDNTKVPDRIHIADVNDILDVYEKYINDWFPEEKIRFQALLVTLIKKSKMEKTAKWKNFQETIQYDMTKSKFKNHIRFLFHENLSQVSSEFIHTRFDQVEHFYLEESKYQKMKQWLTKKQTKLIYSAQRVFHDYKKDLFKKMEKNPWEFHEMNEDVWRISIPKIMSDQFHEIYMKIICDNEDYMYEEESKMFENAPIYVIQLPKEQWDYWAKCAEEDHITYEIDIKHHFSKTDFNCIPILTYEKDYMKVNTILEEIKSGYVNSHIEIPKEKRFMIDGFVFQNGQQLSEKESKIIQKHFRKVGNE